MELLQTLTIVVFMIVVGVIFINTSMIVVGWVGRTVGRPCSGLGPLGRLAGFIAYSGFFKKICIVTSTITLIATFLGWSIAGWLSPVSWATFWIAIFMYLVGGFGVGLIEKRFQRLLVVAGATTEQMSSFKRLPYDARTQIMGYLAPRYEDLNLSPDEERREVILDFIEKAIGKRH
jgi:hypothetical protein